MRLSLRDLLLTPLAELALFLAAGLTTWWVRLALATHLASLGWTGSALVFAFALVLWTLMLLGALRALFPMKSGVYTAKRDPWEVLLWNLQGFLCVTNLGLQYVSGLLPPPLRKPFYRALGAEFGRGVPSVGGAISDPWLVTIGDHVVLGGGSVLTGHLVKGEELYLGRIHVESNAIIGARAMVMPGTTIGRGAVVLPMSLVPMNTNVGAHEVWGGIPARKLREVAVNPEGSRFET